MKRSYTPSDLIDALGGYQEAGQFFGVTQQAVYNWERRSQRFPAARYLEHKALLKAAGIHADVGIWFPEMRRSVENNDKRRSVD
jgi:hypothetical protein